MYIEAEKEELERIESVITEMMVTVNSKGFVDKNDVKSLLNFSHTSNNIIFKNGEDLPVILYTHKGAVVARTNGQQRYFEAVQKNEIVFAVGPAGTGKTYQAMACAVSALKEGLVEKIVITRPAVEAGERLGFLPGDLKEKIDPYLTPLYDALGDMLTHENRNTYLNNRTIEIAPLAYMRGRTLHNSFMILDEAQNATDVQMKMFLTRLGVTSRAIITGDITQSDLAKNETSGLIDAQKKLKTIKGISFVEFDSSDVVRHKLVRQIIEAYENGNKKANK
jgi:phosphate starvation-inducible PhoH-like protein